MQVFVRRRTDVRTIANLKMQRSPNSTKAFSLQRRMETLTFVIIGLWLQILTNVIWMGLISMRILWSAIQEMKAQG